MGDLVYLEYELAGKKFRYVTDNDSALAIREYCQYRKPVLVEHITKITPNEFKENHQKELLDFLSINENLEKAKTQYDKDKAKLQKDRERLDEEMEKFQSKKLKFIKQRDKKKVVESDTDSDTPPKKK